MKAQDLFGKVTDQLIADIEAGAGQWRMPWHRLAEAGTPQSVEGRPYRGFNSLWLPMVAATEEWTAGVWATYQSWQRHGAQVRRGQKGTPIVLWKPAQRPSPGDQDDDGESVGGDESSGRRRWFARGYTVFAAEQVDGAAEILEALDPQSGSGASTPERLAEAESFFAALGADVLEGGNVACYQPAADRIRVPSLAQFDAAEHFYSTLAHEHVHWTGHRFRLNRDLTGAFGSDAYAAEELVAELGAAMWCAHTGIGPAVREDHASYLAQWLRILRADPRHLLTTASRAQAAIDWMTTSAGAAADRDPR